MFLRRIGAVGAVLLACCFGSVFAEDTATQKVVMQVAAVCLVHVTGHPQNLVVSPPDLGGAEPPSSSDDTTYIQYTSITPTGKTRLLTAKWDGSSSAPSGCSLKLNAVPASGPHQGVSAGEIILSSVPQALISNVGSCATGTGPVQGARLKYTLAVDDISLLKAGETRTATVILTLTDSS